MKFKHAGILTKIVVLALLVYGTILIVNTRARVEAAEANRDALALQVDALLQENAELEYDIEHAGDPEIIEDIARSKLGLVTPGEKIYYDVSN